MTPYTKVGLTMHGQPVPHPYFHRPLSALLAPALKAGLVLDAIEECAFPPEHVGGSTPLSWNGRFSEIPAALVVRMRPRSVRDRNAAALCPTPIGKLGPSVICTLGVKGA